MQQKSEFPFDDLTMENLNEVSRVIRYFTLPGVERWDDAQTVEHHIHQTSGDFALFFATDEHRIPRIVVVFETGFTFNFYLYQVGITQDDGVRLFNEFIEKNTDAVCEFMLEHPLWLAA